MGSQLTYFVSKLGSVTCLGIINLGLERCSLVINVVGKRFVLVSLLFIKQMGYKRAASLNKNL